MKTFRLALLGSVIAGIGVMGAVDASAGSDVKKTVKMYGHVNRMVSVQSDGDTTLFNHQDNELSTSRFGVKATAKSANITIQGRFEWRFAENRNRANTVAQVSDSTSNVDGRWSDISFATKYGKVFMGHGESSSDNMIKADLSGTTLVLQSGRALSGNMGFAAKKSPDNGNGFAGNAGTVGAHQVQDVLRELDGASRTNRIRYDTPKFAGIGLSIDNATGGRMSYAVTYGAKLAGFKIKSKIAHYNRASTTNSFEKMYGGSVSVLHDSGVSATYAFAVDTNNTQSIQGNNSAARSPGRRATHYGKLGYKANFTDLGKTSMGVDYNVSYDGVTNGDRAAKWGVGVVQKLSAYGTELYAAYEHISLSNGDRTGDASQVSGPGVTHVFNDINAGYFGARVKW